MPPDIVARIELQFGQNAREAIELLEAFVVAGQIRETNRVIRCLVHLAGGSIPKLCENIQLAEVDYRDVIWNAEYDHSDERKRDLSIPFAS